MKGHIVKNWRGFFILGLALVMASMTGLLIFNWLERQQGTGQHALQGLNSSTTMTAVAAVNLDWGTRLTTEMIKLVPVPSASLPQGTFHQASDLVGRVLVAHITENEPILPYKLAPLDVKDGGVAAVTDPAKRAMSIKVDDVVGVAGFINPGNRVDVLVTLREDPPMTKTVLQNVVILATGTEIERRGEEAKPHVVKVVTVEVTPEEGELLALASNEGKLQLALRPQLTVDPVLTDGATIEKLKNAYRTHAPVKLEKAERVAKRSPQPRRAAPTKVEVIRGGESTTYTFQG
jgi:pilus assembly protein CpaB